MFVLDTNVLSEVMKSVPTPTVAHWLSLQSRNLVFTTVISKAEILSGIATMPAGRRKRNLEVLAEQLLGTGFRDRVLPFDDAAASNYADITARRYRAGRPIGTFDCIIAAIARARDATVVTRDVGGFELAGVSLINPWDPNQT